jgi:HAD superfamily hydrolase (TIGR01509 family)
MTQTVIFDMDGVIIDSEPLHHISQKKLTHKLGFSLTETQAQQFIGTSSKNMWQTLKTQYELPQSVEELMEMGLESYFDILDKTPIEPIAGVRELIEDLHAQKIRMVLASSSERKSIDKVLKLFSLEQYFDCRISGAEFVQSKPHPEIFLTALHKTQSHPNQAVVIEDSTNGIKAAKAAGIFCFGYDNPNSPGQALHLSDRIIDSFLHPGITDIILRK